MEFTQEGLVETGSVGTVKIANDVVATIASLATVDVDGVEGMSGGIANGIAEILGRKQLTKGVKVEVKETEAIIDIYVIIRYGTKIPEASAKIQKNVKEAVEVMTGLNAVSVNVYVQGVVFPEETKESPAAEDK